MARSIRYIVLSTVILVNSLMFSIIQLDFHLNQSRIAAVFCVNKAQPELECEGRCELDRRLDNAQDQEENRNAVNQKELIWNYTVPEKGHYPERAWHSMPGSFGEPCHSSFIYLGVTEFFHPPQV